MTLLSPTLLDSLGERLCRAVTLTPALIADVIGAFRQRLPSLSQEVRSKRVGQLIRLGAWTDVALELIELELPQWKVRRLAYDDGEWFCALSCERDLPDWLDHAVEGRHPDLALAILTALIEASKSTSDPQGAKTLHAPLRANSLFEPMLSDNFA